MARIMATLIGLGLLASCGADGRPVPPSKAPRDAEVAPGLTISGTAEIGIAGTR